MHAPHAHLVHHVAARFDDAKEVEEVMQELRDLGDERRVAIDVHEAGMHELDVAEARLARSIGEGLAAGAVVGGLVGAVLMAVLGAQVADIDVGTLVAGGAVGGVLLGMLFGAITGMAMRQAGIQEATWWEGYHLHPGEEIIVAAIDEGRARRSHASHGTATGEEPFPVDRTVERLFQRHHGTLVPCR